MTEWLLFQIARHFSLVDCISSGRLTGGSYLSFSDRAWFLPLLCDPDKLSGQICLKWRRVLHPRTFLKRKKKSQKPQRWHLLQSERRVCDISPSKQRKHTCRRWNPRNIRLIRDVEKVSRPVKQVAWARRFPCQYGADYLFSPATFRAHLVPFICVPEDKANRAHLSNTDTKLDLHPWPHVHKLV